MVRTYNSKNLAWNGAHLLSGKKLMATVVQDADHPGMFRILLPDGTLSDMVNLTRAKDAAKSIALGILNMQETATE